MRESLLCLKRKFLYEFLQKCFKTTERHSLAVCRLLCGEKQFLLIFIHFYWFHQKKLLKQIQIFLRICPFSNMVRKTNFLSFSVLVSDIVIFMSKKKSSLWIIPQDFPPYKHGKKNKLSEYFSLQKCFKTTERHSLAVCAYFVKKKVFVNIYPLFLIWSKQLA